MAGYTDTELEAIARWLKDGLSASRISDRLSAGRGGAVSRNAVIGIVHRNPLLSAIGFANPGGGRSGGRPRKATVEPCARQAGSAGQAELPGQAKLPGQAELPGQAKLPGQVRPVAAKPLKPASPVKSVRLAPPVWLPQRQIGLDVGAPVPADDRPKAARPVVARRQPHVAAMRFIDCLFDRCRAPLDLTLEEDPENDAPGARPGADMLCCGLRTRGLESYCTYHAARFHDHRRTLLADAASSPPASRASGQAAERFDRSARAPANPPADRRMGLQNPRSSPPLCAGERWLGEAETERGPS